jgi:hypothetical protein
VASPELPLPPLSGAIAPDALKAINDSYYAEAVKAPASARSRAQAAYAIAAAIATALVTAGVLTDFNEQQPVVKVFGLIAVAAWMATALIFMLAVGVGVNPDQPSTSARRLSKAWFRWLLTRKVQTARPRSTASAAAFVDDVFQHVEHEVNTLNGTIYSGWICALVASGLTLLTFILTFSVKPNTKATEKALATLGLAPLAQHTVANVCQNKPTPLPRRITGILELDTIQKGLIRVTVTQRRCPKAGLAAKNGVLLRLPSKQITGIAVAAKQITARRSRTRPPPPWPR